MFGLPKFGDGIGLHRIDELLGVLGVDRAALSRRSIAVTGSNGKGSTARFIASALGAGGGRVGLFTSPHMFHFRERFRIGDQVIPAAKFDELARIVTALNEELPEGDRLGAFEFLFLVAVLWFEQEGLDAIVWEAGIGGRYDPVRAVRAGVSALTSIELEHTQLLGATEELIAYDKVDALAPGGTLVVSPSVPAHLYERIAAYARLSDKRIFIVSETLEIGPVENRADGARFLLADRKTGIKYPAHLQLIGRHQADNAVTALCAASLWKGNATSPANADTLDAISATNWPGRLERVARDPDLWIDVGHTPKAIDAVTSAFLDFVPRERVLVVFGVSASKEVAAISGIAAGRFDRFVLTRAHKAGADISSFADAFAGKDVTVEQDIAAAARFARERAQREGLAVLAIGGLFLAVEVQHAWNGGDPQELEFL